MRPSFRWSTLPAGYALALVLSAVFGLMFLPQAAAIAILAPGAFADRRLSVFELLGLWGRPDPSRATGSAWPGLVHHLIVWTVLLALIAAVVVTVLILRARAKDPQRTRGLASVSDAAKELGVRQLVHVRGQKLRPALPPESIRPADVGYRVGRFWGTDLWLRIEDPIIVIGPSRAGKGWYLVLSWILSAPGAVITTSSKMDNALLTLRQRERQGSTCWIFAPGIEGGDRLGHVLRWDPVAGCVDERTLVRRVKALIPGDSFSGSTSNGGHWDTLGQQLAAHLFHAAACLDAGVDKIWEWVGSPQRALEAVAAIREHPEGLLEHAAHLGTVIGMPAEQRATQWGVLPTVLAFLESRDARAWMTPAAGGSVDLVDFVLGRGTLYLVGDKETSRGYVRIIDGLLAELDHITKGFADASPGARLEPPVSYILDEAGNFEYQGLYELITAGGGRGRVAIAVFQSREQLTGWGQSQAKTMWDAAVAKIILPGGADQDELQALSRLIGELWVSRESHSYSQGPASVSVSEERRAVLEASDIREMPAGYSLLFYRNLKPVIALMTPFNEHPDFAGCAEDAAQLGAQLQATSPFAAQLTAHRTDTTRPGDGRA